MTLARSIGMHTIAEFVGSDEMVATLGNLGVDYVLGFGIGKPGRSRRCRKEGESW